MTLLLIPLAIPSTGGTVAVNNSLLPGAFPEYRLDCTGGECTVVKANCTNSFMELGVVCKNYEDLYKECSMNCTLPVTTPKSPTTQQGKLINAIDYFTPRQPKQLLLTRNLFVRTIQI